MFNLQEFIENYLCLIYRNLQKITVFESMGKQFKRIDFFMLLIVGKVSKTCLIGQYQCDNGDCIDVIFRCDSQQDCFDGSDEKNCCMYIVDIFVCYDVFMNKY